MWRRSAQRRSDIQPVNATYVALARRTAPRWPPGQKKKKPFLARGAYAPSEERGGLFPPPPPAGEGRDPNLVPGAWCLGPGAWGLGPGAWSRVPGGRCSDIVAMCMSDSRWKWRLCDVRCAVAKSAAFVSFPLAKENLSFPVGKEKVPLPRREGRRNALGICDRCIAMHLACERSHVQGAWVGVCVCDRAWCGMCCAA